MIALQIVIGTSWIIPTLVTVVIALVGFLLKRAIFDRIDRIEATNAETNKQVLEKIDRVWKAISNMTKEHQEQVGVLKEAIAEIRSKTDDL